MRTPTYPAASVGYASTARKTFKGKEGGRSKGISIERAYSYRGPPHSHRFFRRVRKKRNRDARTFRGEPLRSRARPESRKIDGDNWPRLVSERTRHQLSVSEKGEEEADRSCPFSVRNREQYGDDSRVGADRSYSPPSIRDPTRMVRKRRVDARRNRALERSRRRAINRKKNPPELSVRFSVHAVASMAIEARQPRPDDRVTVRADPRPWRQYRCVACSRCYHCRALSECNDVSGTRDQAGPHTREPCRGLLIIRFFLAILSGHPSSLLSHPLDRALSCSSIDTKSAAHHFLANSYSRFLCATNGRASESEGFSDAGRQ